jgi:prophage antirepressor-like protein
MIELNTQNELSNSDKQEILNKFPPIIAEKFKNINNPLNQTEILVELFREKNVRIILKIQKNEFDEEDYIAHFHVVDMCKTINYADHHINTWKKWKIKFFTYEELTKDNSKIFIINPNNNKISHKALFIDEESIITILIKINTPEAHIFTEWIKQQSKIVKTLMRRIIKIKNELENQKYLNENIELRKKVELLESQVDHEQIYERLQVALCVMPKMEHIKGIIYIGSTKDLILKKISKIGKTIDAQRRKTELRVGNPTFNLYMEFEF